jgi:hypothetical protein
VNVFSDPSGSRKVFATRTRRPARPWRSLLSNSHAVATREIVQAVSSLTPSPARDRRGNTR